MLNQWQLQQAKNKFSQVVRQAKRGQPQYVTVHGKPTVVILSIEDYQNLIICMINADEEIIPQPLLLNSAYENDYFEFRSEKELSGFEHGQA